MCPKTIPIESSFFRWIVLSLICISIEFSLFSTVAAAFVLQLNLLSFFHGGFTPLPLPHCLSLLLSELPLYVFEKDRAVMTAYTLHRETDNTTLLPLYFFPPLSLSNSGSGCRYPQQNCVQSQWPCCHKTFLCDWPVVGERTPVKDRACGFKSDLFSCSRIQRIASFTKNLGDDNVSRLLITSRLKIFELDASLVDLKTQCLT